MQNNSPILNHVPKSDLMRSSVPVPCGVVLPLHCTQQLPMPSSVASSCMSIMAMEQSSIHASDFRYRL